MRSPSENPPSSSLLPSIPGETSGRHASLDTLRGALLVLMAVNHIPSVLWPLTQQPLGFATAAEVFVFLAGLVVGLVYGRRWETLGPRTTRRALLGRAGVIYQAHLACVLGIFAWMLLYSGWHATGQPPVASPWIWFQRPWASWLSTLLLVNQPGLLDVLPTYCGLLFLTPLALDELSKNRWARVIGLSFLWWALTNRFDPPRPTIIGVVNTGAFNFGAWQLLYIAGVVAGHAWFRGTLPRWRPRRITVALLVLAVAFLSACSHGWITLGLSPETWFALSNKNNLAPVRLVNVALLILLGHLWLRGRRDDLGLPLLAMLGRHSLAVFAVHCVLAMVMLGLPTWFEWHPRGPVIGPVLMLLVLFLTAECAERWNRVKRSKRVAVGFGSKRRTVQVDGR